MNRGRDQGEVKNEEEVYTLATGVLLSQSQTGGSDVSYACCHHSLYIGLELLSIQHI